VNEALERFLDLLDAAERDGTPTAGTSVRMPVALRDAAVAAVDAGLLPSLTDATVRGLRTHLQAIANRAVLDEHYREHPEVRPERWEIALATAEIDGHPLVDRPDLVRRAATEILATMDDPTPEEILAFAAGLAAGPAAA
jgi:hypothetical protein